MTISEEKKASLCSVNLLLLLLARHNLTQFNFLTFVTASVHSSNLDAEECVEDDLGDVLCPGLSPGEER